MSLLRAFPSRGIQVEQGAGSWLTNGQERYLDLGGASHGVAILGHRPPRVVEAIRSQADQLLHVAQGMEQSVRDAFVAALHEQLPGNLTSTFIANSGTEAWECALKLAASTTGRSEFIAATGAFHGRTLGSLSTTHKPAYRGPFRGTYAEQTFVEFNDEDALKAAISNRTAAICLEPIQGESGVIPATESYLRTARDLCDDHGALLVLDEIQSGFGRTGSFLAASVEADIVTLAKGVAGGLPIGTCSVSQVVAEAVVPGSHGSTYGGNPMACAAGLAMLQELTSGNWLTRAPRLFQAAQETLESAPGCSEIRGRGAMLGIGVRLRPARILQGLQDAGILALGAGNRGVRLLPPLNISEEDWRFALQELAKLLGQEATP